MFSLYNSLRWKFATSLGYGCASLANSVTMILMRVRHGIRSPEELLALEIVANYQQASESCVRDYRCKEKIGDFIARDSSVGMQKFFSNNLERKLAFLRAAAEQDDKYADTCKYLIERFSELEEERPSEPDVM